MSVPYRPCPADRGFVLVGVVVFILALTILGLSLFSLSSFEAQFLTRSSRDTQTLYDAMGGVEWAKMVLSKERRLQAVQDGQPSESTRPSHVVYVEAWQGNNNSGALNFNSGQPVRIRSLAQDDRGIRRMVEQMFEPTNPDTMYGAIVDSYGNFNIPSMAGIPLTERRSQTYLNGAIRVRTDTDPDWRLAPGAMTDWGRNAPQPKVQPYISDNSALLGTQAIDGHTNSGQFDLLGVDPTGINFFKSPGVNGSSVLEQFSASSTIRVANTCVWLLPQGARFNGPVRVEAAGSNPRLVIVAGGLLSGSLPGNYGYIPPPYVGLWFYGSLSSVNVPVVLVSDARIILENEQQTAQNNVINDLTIWGAGVKITGPEAGYSFVAYHTGATDAIIQELGAKGALPGGLGKTSAWPPIRGTWRELDPDNPS